MRVKVSRKMKVRIGKFLSFIDFLVCELEYRIMRFVYILETPRVIREAEHELHRAGILQELDDDEGDEDWLRWDDEPDDYDDYYDGREWWMRDNDNPGDR